MLEIWWWWEKFTSRKIKGRRRASLSSPILIFKQVNEWSSFTLRTSNVVHCISEMHYFLLCLIDLVEKRMIIEMVFPFSLLYLFIEVNASIWMQVKCSVFTFIVNAMHKHKATFYVDNKCSEWNILLLICTWPIYILQKEKWPGKPDLVVLKWLH